MHVCVGGGGGGSGYKTYEKGGCWSCLKAYDPVSLRDSS